MKHPDRPWPTPQLAEIDNRTHIARIPHPAGHVQRVREGNSPARTVSAATRPTRRARSGVISVREGSRPSSPNPPTR